MLPYQPAPFPLARPRRLRASPWVRRLVAETTLTPADLIWPLIVHDGAEDRQPVASMPGVFRLSPKEAAKAAVEARDLGIPLIALFPNVDGAIKDAVGTGATDPDGLIPDCIKAIKDAVPEIGVIYATPEDRRQSHGSVQRAADDMKLTLRVVAPENPAGAPAIVLGQNHRLVTRDPGGPFTKAFSKAFYEPFKKATGVTVVGVASESEPSGMVKAMVESGNVIWDLVQMDERERQLKAAIAAAERGQLDPRQAAALRARR